MRWLIVLLLAGALLPAAGMARAQATAVPSCGLPVAGGTVSSDTTYTLTSNCNLTGVFTIASGITLTIEGGGHTIYSAPVTSDTAMFGATAGTLVLRNLTLDDSTSATTNLAAVVVVPSLQATNVTFRNGNDLMVQVTNNGSATLSNVLFENNYRLSERDGNALYGSGSTLTISLTNAVIRNNFGGDAALFAAGGTVTLNGCFTDFGNFPAGIVLPTAATLTDNSTGACSGTIGNGDPAVAAEASPAACGLPTSGELESPATFVLVSDCTQTGGLYLNNAEVTVHGNGHTISGSTTLFYVSLAGTLNLNDVTTTSSGRSILNVGTLNVNRARFLNHSLFVSLLNYGGTANLNGVRFEGNAAQSGGALGSAVGNFQRNGAIVRYSVTNITDAIFRNNSGSTAAVLNGPATASANTYINLNGCRTFDGNTPADTSGSNIFDRSTGACSVDPSIPGPYVSPPVTPRPRSDSGRDSGGPPPAVDCNHPATPLAVYPTPYNSLSFDFYAVLSAQEGQYLFSLPRPEALRAQGHGGGLLLQTSHPFNGKSISVTYQLAQNRLLVSTFYPDAPPHDIDKPYVYALTADSNCPLNLEW